jgi:type II secretory pathway pseudopilin PulG
MEKMMASSDRRGFAMPAVMGALVIIGILATAGFYMAQQELRIGVATNHTNLAVNIAQAGANEVMANWNGYQLGNIQAWQDTTITGTAPGGTWSVRIMNGNNYSYLIESTGTVTQGGALWAGAQRRVGIAAKILFADISPPAALMTRGPVQVTGAADVVGFNTTPPSWGPYCTDVATNDTTGILVNDSSVVDEGKGTVGNPAVDEDPNIVDSTFTDFGNLTWDELVAIAQIEGKDLTPLGTTINGIGPTTVAGRCETANLRNWGDTVPTNVCGSYFPLIYHGGPNMYLQANSFGQGILLVDGNLQLEGGFTFMGIIIVQGSFSTGSGTNRVYGSVMASNSADILQTMTGTGEIYYSRCAITRAVLNNSALSRARPLAERSWVDLSSALN